VKRRQKTNRPIVSAEVARATPAARMTMVEAWLTRRWVWIMAALLAASAGGRIAYFLQLNRDPAIELPPFVQSDMNYFDVWGRKVARGDWLSASVSVPMHDWQRAVSHQYLADHPEIRTALVQQAKESGAAADADLLLWSRWMGGHQFYQDPLYPYLIGLTYRVFGEDVPVVFAWLRAVGAMSGG